jgi:CDP-glucose 4,6-dehydratase
VRFLVTGHTGFKGTWLTMYLKYLGHTVSGLSIGSEPHWLCNQVNLKGMLTDEYIGDVRDWEFVKQSFRSSEFDAVVHLAAQSLVRESFRRPRFTFETNVQGTLNVLESYFELNRRVPILIVTTDKVYRNDGRRQGYIESDALGSSDPYSASKAMADLMTQSLQELYSDFPIAIARAGNVIGGGDVSKERLLPDLMNAIQQGLTPHLRLPNAIRPWQHVLDCLNGYYKILEALVISPTQLGAWNIGPAQENIKSVRELTELVQDKMNVQRSWNQTGNDDMPESDFLLLDSSKARRDLGWDDLLSFEESVEWTVNWYRSVQKGAMPREATMGDIERFLSL